jgi:hypothetical protein
MRSARFNIPNSTFYQQCIYMFCMYIREIVYTYLAYTAFNDLFLYPMWKLFTVRYELGL